MDKYADYVNIMKEWAIVNGPNLIAAIFIIVFGRLLIKWISYLVRKALTRSGMDITLIRFLEKILYYTLLIAVFIAAADQVGIETTSFLAILGAAGLAIGLALKDSLSNFASGVMLILFHPFRVGDTVTAGGVSGSVESIEIFNTIINTWDNQKIIVPNSKITSDVITNINANPTRRIDLVIGISYDDNVEEAKSILHELVQADARILSEPAPKIALAEFADSSVNFVVRPWVNTIEYWDVRFDLLDRIKKIFDERNITIPYPQRDVHLFEQRAE